MIYRQTALYRFLFYCEQQPLEKLVVDLGAGGNMPPLGIFQGEGYKTIGIEMNEGQLQRAKEFEQAHGLSLNIRKGDMRQLPFKDEEIPYLYCFNSIFHMSKENIKGTIGEIKRVLQKGGLCYINLLNKADFRYGQGRPVDSGEFLQEEDGEWILHSYFDEDEADNYFAGMEILYKECKVYERIYEGEKIRQGAIEYIVGKAL